MNLFGNDDGTVTLKIGSLCIDISELQGRVVLRTVGTTNAFALSEIDGRPQVARVDWKGDEVAVPMADAVEAYLNRPTDMVCGGVIRRDDLVEFLQNIGTTLFGWLEDDTQNVELLEIMRDARTFLRALGVKHRPLC